MAYEFVQRARVLVEGGQPQEAVKICRLGLLAKPKDLDGRLVLGAALAALHRYDEVLAEMRVALELDAGNPRALALKGEALLRKGKPAQAAEVLRQARHLDPGAADIAAMCEEAAVAAADAEEGAGGADHPGAGFERESRTKHYPIHSAVGASVRNPLGDSASGVEASTFEFRRRPRPAPLPGLTAAPAAGRDAVADPGNAMDSPFSDDEATTVSPVPKADAPAPLEAPPRKELSFVELRSVDILEERGVAEQPLAADDLERAMSQFDEDDSRAAPIRRPNSGLPLQSPPPEPIAGSDFSGGAASGFADESSAEKTALMSTPAPTAAALAADPLAATENDERTHEDEVAPERSPSPSDPASEIAESAQRIASMFPEDEPGVSRMDIERPNQAELAGASPARVDDMRTIRAGLGLPAEDASGGRKGAKQARGTTAPRTGVGRRRGLSALAYVVVAVAVLGGAVFAGLRIRELRLQRQIDAAEASAAASLRDGTYRGYMRARDVYAAIGRVDRSSSARAGLARAQAELAFEFGDGAARAKTEVGALDSADHSLDAVAARAYAALTGAEPQAASFAADIEKRFPNRAIGPYLAGCAALAAGHPTAAVAALGRAVKLAHQPLAYVWLARADAAHRDFSAALDALAQALKRVPGQPEAVIARARILSMERLAAQGDHPAAATAAHGAASGELGRALSALDRVIAQGSRDASAQKLGVSALEVAWAKLAAAEIRVAQGDKSSGRAFVSHLGGDSTAASWRYAEAAASLALDIGDTTTAERQASRAVKRWPSRRAARMLLARAALAGGEPDTALAALENAKALADDPRAQALRGRAYLQAGNLEAAAHDLDKALAAAPDLREAVIARAKVDLKSGDPSAAIERLRPLYKHAKDAQVAVAYASALRQSGNTTKARSVLSAVPPAEAGPELYVELARLDRQQGRFDEAATAYSRAIKLNPHSHDARLEQALLALDTGDVHRARDMLVALAKDATGSGRVLAQAARVNILTGAPDKASAYLDRAAKLPSAPRWLVARERGRLALRTRHVKDAVAALRTATKIAPHDASSWLLLLNAELTAEDGDAAQKTLQGILKKFPNSPEAELALGRDDLYTSRDDDALVALRKARQMLDKEHAPPRRLAVPLFWMGRLYYDTGDLGNSVKSLEQAIRLDPSEADAHYLLGNVQYERGKLKAAANAYNASLKYDPSSNPDAWYYLGDVSFKLGNKAVAKRALAEYKKRVPQGAYIKDADKLLGQLQ